MALQVWLPLTGNLKNLGLSEISQINTTNLSFSDNGKIGKCLTGYTGYFNIPSMAGKKQLSVAYWIRINTATSTNWLDAFRWYSTDGTKTYSSRNEFYTNCTLTGFWFAGSPNSISGKTTTVGEWHHHAFVIDYSTGIAEFYINGVSVGSVTNVYTTHSLTGENFMIGENGLDASINDVRIYDHCLSPKEVKELSKGLVAHYPLNDGIGGANIAWNSSLATDLTSWVKSGTWDFVTKDGFQCCHNTGAFKTTSLIYPKQTFNTTTDGMLPYNGLIMTMSADVLLENVVKGTTNYFLALYRSGETIDGSWKAPTILANSGHFTSAASETLEPSKLNGKGWTHVWVTFKWGDYTWSNTNYRLQFYARDYTGDVYVKNLKIELGEKPTPWIPNPADTLYSKMGLDDKIAYDCSGYEHHGNIVNTTSITSDTPRYKVTTYFNSGAYVRIDNIQSGNLEDSYTMAYWAKIANGKIPCGYRDGNRLNIYITSDLICCNTGDGNQNPFQLNGASVNVEQYYNEWHHYAMSGNGSESKLYIDGEYKGSAKTYRPMTGTHFVINGWDFNTSYKINYISDVRIYATALSAEDIKSLYETKASIDDHGNFYAYEIQEV